MDPSVWGPKLWFVIHTLALNFPDNPSYEDKRHYEDFFNNLTFMIPCDKCRIHYTERIRKNPVINHLENSDMLFRYTIHLHNDVNKSLHKPLLNLILSQDHLLRDQIPQFFPTYLQIS